MNPSSFWQRVSSLQELVDVLIGKAGVGVEAMRVLLCRFGQGVIDALGPVHALISFQHIGTWYGLAYDLRVHPGLVEVGDAGSKVIMAWPVNMCDDDVAGLHYVRLRSGLYGFGLAGTAEQVFDIIDRIVVIVDVDSSLRHCDFPFSGG